MVLELRLKNSFVEMSQLVVKLKKKKKVSVRGQRGGGAGGGAVVGR